MSAEPTTNDFLELIDWHIAKAQDRAARAVNEVRGKAAAAGRFQSGATAIHSIERARTEFDVGVDAVLGELKRVAQSTKLNRDDLRQLAVQRLEKFATAAKAISQAEQFRSMGLSQQIDEQFAGFDRHLQFAVRQFDVGLRVPAEPEVPVVANSITVGTMIGSSIAQASPAAKQTVEFTVNIETATTALAGVRVCDCRRWTAPENCRRIDGRRSHDPSATCEALSVPAHNSRGRKVLASRR